MSTEPTSDDDSHPWRPFLLLCIAVFAVWAVFLAIGLKSSDQISFADLFQSASALFAGLAFAGVIYALRLQMNELALQRQELKETRAELRRAAVAQEKTEKAMTQQVYVAALHSALDSAILHARGMPGIESGQQKHFEAIGKLEKELDTALDRIRHEACQPARHVSSECA